MKAIPVESGELSHDKPSGRLYRSGEVRPQDQRHLEQNSQCLQKGHDLPSMSQCRRQNQQRSSGGRTWDYPWIDRIQGVIPFEDSSLKKPEDARDIIGHIVAFKVKEIDSQKLVFVASRREALEQMASLTWKTIEPGRVRVAAVRAVTRV